MSKLGFEKGPEIPCPHQDSWALAKLVGFGLRQCGVCGRTWVLVLLDDGSLAWEAVSEPSETQDLPKTIITEVEDDGDSLADVDQDLLALSPGEGEQ